MRFRTMAAGIAVAVAATGCMNLATKPSEITGSYTSDLKYQDYTCSQLGIEVNSLARREDQLNTAQEQRRKSGKVQAFWLGYGTGDGIEASELANVRGEKEAVRRAMDKKSCNSTGSRPAPRAVSYTQTQPAPEQRGAEAAGSWRGWAPAADAPKKTLYRCPSPSGGEVVTESPAAGCIVI